MNANRWDAEGGTARNGAEFEVGAQVMVRGLEGAQKVIKIESVYWSVGGGDGRWTLEDGVDTEITIQDEKGDNKTVKDTEILAVA